MPASCIHRMEVHAVDDLLEQRLEARQVPEGLRATAMRLNNPFAARHRCFVSLLYP